MLTITVKSPLYQLGDIVYLKANGSRFRVKAIHLELQLSRTTLIEGGSDKWGSGPIEYEYHLSNDFTEQFVSLLEPTDEDGSEWRAVRMKDTIKFAEDALTSEQPTRQSIDVAEVKED